MQPLYEEDEPTGGIPDPSTRTWRHPSEVAAEEAANAAAAQTLEHPVPCPDDDRKRRPHLIGAVLAAALCTSGLVFGGILQPGAVLRHSRSQTGENPDLEFNGSQIAASNRSLSPPADFDYDGPGVFSPDDDFLARFVFTDDVIFTSASALAGLTQVLLFFGEGHEPTTATVERLIPEQDIAVLRPAEPLPDGVDVLTGGSPPKISDTVSIEDCSEVPRTMNGDIRATGKSTLTVTGEQLSGLLLTSLPALPCSPGSPILRGDELIGMAVNGDNSVTMIVPLETLTKV